jgi:hypothetical protein
VVYVLKFRVKGGVYESIPHPVRRVFRPSRAVKRPVELLSNVTGGDFVPETIEIRELRDFDPIEVRGQGATVFSCRSLSLP